MSFILDALKKSEAERQRQAGPTLLELRITRPRRRYPTWSLIVGALLAANIVVLLLFVLRKPSTTSPESAANVSAAPAPASAPSTPASATAPAAVPVPAAAPATALRAAAQPAAPVTAAPVTAAPVTAAPVTAAPVTAAPVTAGPVVAGPAAVPAAPAAQASAEDQPAAGAVSASADTHNPADYEPALPAGSEHPESAVDYSNLPSIGQLSGNMPALQLDLLDYSDLASERYALINMHRVREGDVLPEGARVLAITRDGVALDYRGQDFMLRPGGTAQ